MFQNDFGAWEKGNLALFMQDLILYGMGVGKEGGSPWARGLALLSKRKFLPELKPPMEVNGEDCLEK